MAEVRPLKALHYDLSAVSSLADVTAPPYDVIDAEQRASCSPARPSTSSRSTCRRRRRAAIPTSTPPRRSRRGRSQGVLAADREPAIWALTQDYTGPDGNRRTRHGFLARVRVDRLRRRPRPPPRAHPARPASRTACGSPAPPATTSRRSSPSPRGRLAARRAPARRRALGRGRPTPTARCTASGGSPTRRSTRPSPQTLADAELLIADGHHRYETARAYADEIGGEGPHRYTLMCLVSLDDPGLTVFATHRLLGGLADDRAPGAPRPTGSASSSRSRRSARTISTRPARRASASSATSTPTSASALPPAAQGRGERRRARSADRSEAYRRLDAVILEDAGPEGHRSG